MKEEIIFPAFVSMYNKNGHTFIYYYRGLTSDGNFVYKTFNENDLPKHNKTIMEDGAIIYEFNTIIKSLQCNLISDIDIKNKKIYIANK